MWLGILFSILYDSNQGNGKYISLIFLMVLYSIMFAALFLSSSGCAFSHPMFSTAFIIKLTISDDYAFLGCI